MLRQSRCTATNEDGFKIERSLSSGSGWSQIATTGINTLTFTNTGLTSGTRYYYRVRSYNAAGNSAYSNAVTLRVQSTFLNRLLPRFRTSWCYECGWHGMLRSGPLSPSTPSHELTKLP